MHPDGVADPSNSQTEFALKSGQGHLGPVGIAIGDNSRKVGGAVDMFDSGLDPVGGVGADEKPGLIVLRPIVAAEPDFDGEFWRSRGQEGMTAVVDETVECILPEIALVACGDMQGIALHRRRGGWVQPSHAVGPHVFTPRS